MPYDGAAATATAANRGSIDRKAGGGDRGRDERDDDDDLGERDRRLRALRSSLRSSLRGDRDRRRVARSAEADDDDDEDDDADDDAEADAMVAAIAAADGASGGGVSARAVLAAIRACASRTLRIASPTLTLGAAGTRLIPPTNMI